MALILLILLVNYNISELLLTKTTNHGDSRFIIKKPIMYIMNISKIERELLKDLLIIENKELPGTA